MGFFFDLMSPLEDSALVTGGRPVPSKAVAAFGVAFVVGLACTAFAQHAAAPSLSYAVASQTATPSAITSIRGAAPSLRHPESRAAAATARSAAISGPESVDATHLTQGPVMMGALAAVLFVGSALFARLAPSRAPAPLHSLAVTATPAPATTRLQTAMVDPSTAIAMMTVTSVKRAVGIRSPVFSETCDQTGITLTRFMLEVARANPDLQELESVFAAIQTACKTISKLVRRSAIDGMTGLQAGGGSVNVQGEEQKKLDVITNDVLKRALKFTGRMGVLASEEEDVPVEVDNAMDSSYGNDVLVEESGGRYISVFDPLDGSSNVDAGIPVGTIFGIFNEDADCRLSDSFFADQGDMTEAMKGCLRSTLKPGNSLVAAGYCLYSSATHFVFTLGAGVNGFTLDESIGEFILTHPNIRIPPRGKIYSINEANREKWDLPVQDFISGLGTGKNRGKTIYTSRYIGSMVGDVHRTLLYGGVFGYPADTKNVNGKLRLLYEAAPMSFLIEQAGGRSTTGLVRVMDIPPKGVHQRVPVMMGGSDEMEELEEAYRKLADAKLKESQLERLVVA